MTPQKAKKRVSLRDRIFDVLCYPRWGGFPLSVAVVALIIGLIIGWLT